MKKLIVLCLFLTGCATQTVNSEESQLFTISYQKQEITDRRKIGILRDNETGVNYIFVLSDSSAYSQPIAITPRYNADGSLYVD